MSYDLSLCKKDGIKEPFPKDEIEALGVKFDIIIRKLDEKNNVVGFTTKNKNDKFDWLEDGFDFWYQDEGYYATNISYSASKEAFDYFVNLASNLANELNIKVIDNQTDLDLDEEEAKENFDYDKKTTELVINSPLFEEIVNLKLTAKSKYFIMYLLWATDPQTGKKVVLTYDSGKTYCSKVNPGETLRSVIDKEIPMLVGSKEYKFVKMLNGGTAPDRYGNYLPRFNIYIEIPYFNPKERQLNFDFSWKEIKPV